MFILLRCFLLGYDSSPCKSVNDCKYWRFLLCKSIGVVHQFSPPVYGGSGGQSGGQTWLDCSGPWPPRTSLLHCTADPINISSEATLNMDHV